MQNISKLLFPVLIALSALFSCDLPMLDSDLNDHSDYGDQSRKPFITTWNTKRTKDNNDSLENQIRLPLVPSGEYDFKVSWGDGQVDTITSWKDPDKTHTYSHPGIYDVEITGRLKGWSFGTNSDRYKIIEVKQWGCFVVGQETGQFKSCMDLEKVSADDAPILNETNSLNRFFEDCRDLEKIASLDKWNTESISYMSHLFLNCWKFNEDISGWNTSNVVTMRNMFYDTRFNQDISKWDVSNVEDMAGMFYSTPFNQNISKWNVSKVENMRYMFFYSDFNLDISLWNVSSVKDMEEMFSYSQFNRDVSKWNVSNVENMKSMFSNTPFNQDISSWKTANVMRMDGMFYSSAFNQDISRWDTSKVTHMSSMFSDNKAFNQDISQWNTSNVYSFQRMFDGASYIPDISGWDITGAENLSDMFKDTSLSSDRYDALLISWAKQPVQKGVSFDAGNSKYTSAAAAARKKLIDEKGWRIFDDGLQP